MFKNRFILILVIVSVMFPFLAYLLNFYTDWLFFVETGFPTVFTTTLYAQTGAGLFFATLLFGGVAGAGAGAGGMGGGGGIGLFEIALLAGIGYLIYRYIKKKRADSSSATWNR